MPETFPVVKELQWKLKNIVTLLILWLVLVLAAGITAAQFFPDSSATYVSIAAGAALLLFAWWLILSWRIRNHAVLELQELLVANQMIPYHFVKLKGSMPWSISSNQKKLLAACDTECKALREKVKTANQTLEKYVGTSVTEKAAKKALQSELGGESRRVYVLFSDVRGFTHMTEQLKPEETVDILNKMFTAMEEVIAQNGGDINKYIGDAIFAYFRRPYGNEGEAAKTVLRTAMRMQDRFEALNRNFSVAYSQEVKIGLGIGITAGEAIVGNLGSANRMEFTLIGDTVNMASRLCGVAKHGQILVNEGMAQAVKDTFELSALPPMQIKGKSEMQTPYAVLGERLGIGR